MDASRLVGKRGAVPDCELDELIGNEQGFIAFVRIFLWN